MNAATKERTITLIPVARLFPHPDNPRKDVGDVTELAESIKANGILQNLTVVPYVSPDNNRVMDGMYTVIIGHRRLAAAQAAGIDEVPCVIAEMTEEEQLSTMLTENMQRTDLTIYEQAKAFQQLSLDLGMSVQEIAEKSGFSETTVRRRTKLADLDEKAFKKACDRGATLFDFAELDKLESPEAKQKCLEAIGTQNFKNVLKVQLEEQRTKHKMAKWLEQLDVFATRIEKTAYIDGHNRGEVNGELVAINYHRNYGSWSKDEDIEKPEDADEIRYFYIVSDTQINVYKEEVEDSAEEEERRKREEIRAKDEAAWARIEKIQARHKELRRDFILNFGSAKSKVAVIMRNLADGMLWEAERNYYSNLDTMELCEWLGIEYDSDTRMPNRQELAHLKVESPERLMLIMAYWYMDKYGGYAKHDWSSELSRWVIRYKNNQKLNDLYYFLTELGYVLSDEERQIAGGTHELFYKDDEQEV